MPRHPGSDPFESQRWVKRHIDRERKRPQVDLARYGASGEVQSIEGTAPTASFDSGDITWGSSLGPEIFDPGAGGVLVPQTTTAAALVVVLVVATAADLWRGKVLVGGERLVGSGMWVSAGADEWAIPCPAVFLSPQLPLLIEVEATDAVTPSSTVDITVYAVNL